MLGYTLDLINDINIDVLFTSGFGVLSRVTRCSVELSDVRTTDEGDVFQVGELPFCTVTMSVVSNNDKNELQVFVMPLSGSLDDMGNAADWMRLLRRELVRSIQDYLPEGKGHERIQTA